MDNNIDFSNVHLAGKTDCPKTSAVIGLPIKPNFQMSELFYKRSVPDFQPIFWKTWVAGWKIQKDLKTWQDFWERGILPLDQKLKQWQGCYGRLLLLSEADVWATRKWFSCFLLFFRSLHLLLDQRRFPYHFIVSDQKFPMSMPFHGIGIWNS